MASSNNKTKKGFETLVQGVDWKTPDFKLSSTIIETLDPIGIDSTKGTTD